MLLFHLIIVALGCGAVLYATISEEWLAALSALVCLASITIFAVLFYVADNTPLHILCIAGELLSAGMALRLAKIHHLDVFVRLRSGV